MQNITATEQTAIDMLTEQVNAGDKHAGEMLVEIIQHLTAKYADNQ